MSFRRYSRWWAGAAGLLLAACQSTPAALTGPALVVLGPTLPSPVPPAIRFRPDSALPGTPVLYLYLHPGPAADTATVPWLRALRTQPTAPWRVEFARRGRLRGQPLRYVRQQRLWAWPAIASLYQGAEPRWELRQVALTYPQLPPNLGPGGINARLYADCYLEHRRPLFVSMGTDAAYDAVPLLRRRQLTDTTLLYRRRPVQVGLLELPGGRPLLSLIEAEQTCATEPPTYEAALYGSELESDSSRRSYPVRPEQLFRPALRRLLTQAVLQLVQDTRRRHHWPLLLPAQYAAFYHQFDPYQQAAFTPHGLLLRCYPPSRDYDPLAQILPSGAGPLALLVPYHVLTPYLQPEP